MYLTPSVQETVLAALKAKVAPHVPYVFDYLYYFAGREDFAAVAGIEYVKNQTEAQFAQIFFKTFRDNTTQPTCDDPTTILEYRLVVFYEYKAIRKAVSPSLVTTNSRQEFVAAIINLRNAFNFNQILIANVAEHSSLVVVQDIVNNEESRYIKDVKGDYIEFLIQVEVQ